MRKKLLFGAFGVMCACTGGLIVHAATPGIPEIDNADATISVQGNLTQTACVGEDGISYTTLIGKYTGGESENVAGSTDYPLTGKLAIKMIKWTINGSTGRGIFTSNIVLTNSAGMTQYSGRLTLVSDGFPATGALIPARGWIQANFKTNDDGVAPPNDDNLIANVEFKLGVGGAVGQFGNLNATFGFANYSAVTNLAPNPADGTF